MKNLICILALLCGLFILAGPALAGDDLDLAKAVKIGSGKTTVIEFTDPDCPYCRKAAKYFQERKDVTLYIFLKPLAIHPQSKEKVRYILSSPDPARTYEEVMNGLWDTKKPTGITPEGIRRQEEQQEIARKNRIDATPTFMIFGRVIEGFDQRRLDELLR